MAYPSYQGYNRRTREGGMNRRTPFGGAGTRAPLLPPRTPARSGGYTSPRKPILPPDANPGYPDMPAGPSGPQSQQPTYGPAQSFEDPALAQIRALAARSRSEATARALAKKKQAAIEYGDASGITGLDEATIEAARNNPFSVLKNTERAYTQGVASLEDALNKSNLFYSGHRGQELGKAATGYQQQKYGASTRFQAGITDIEDALAQALLAADQQEMMALWNSGGGGGASGGLGGPTGWGITTGTGQGDPRKSGIAGALIATPYDPMKDSDIEYAVPGRGDDDNQGGWQRDGDGWYSPIYGIRVDENGRIR